MTVGKRRVGFCLLAGALAALLLLFSTAYLLYVLLVLAALAAALAVLIRVDARRITLSAKAASGGRVGQRVRVTLTAGGGRLFAAGYAAVDLEIRNIMFGTVRRQRFVLPLRGREEQYETALEMDLCGETLLRCVGARVWDVLGLFSAECAPMSTVRLVCYPQPVQLALTLSRDTVGAANAEGLMQNRRGGDPSETFDVREYVPGDDVRAIHWKLSCKTDTLIVREASEPSHYDVVLLPDLGLSQLDGEVTYRELNSAAALTVALGEELLGQGVSFCLALPTKRGLQLYEVPGRRELHQLLPQWLAMEIQPHSGAGLTLFLTEHLEQYFTRMLLISAGKYTRNLAGAAKRIGVTVVSTADDVSAPVYTTLEAGCEAVVLPSRQERGNRYKIAC